MNRKPAVALTAVALIASGCGGSSNDKPAPKAAAAGSTAPAGADKPNTAPYNPKIDPSKFSAKITQPYLPWKPGTKWIYDGTKDGKPQHVEVTVTNKKKTVLGVPCVVVSDIVTVNNTLHEKTTDWYSQDNKGNVWYFGEDTAEYANGVVINTNGTWEAGVDGAKPGIVLQAHPTVGQFYRQEYRPGVAEDQARVLTLNDTQTVPAGTFHNVIRTKDIDPLNPAKIEHKWYAKGIGAIHVIRLGSAHHEEIKLVKKIG